MVETCGHALCSELGAAVWSVPELYINAEGEEDSAPERKLAVISCD